MADGFNIAISDTHILAKFDALPSQFRAMLYAKALTLSLLLEAKIKGKLSNDVLHVVTGRLRRGVFTSVQIDGDKVTVVAGVSADVPYARIHELGYVGPEEVRAHLRTVSSVFGRELKVPIVQQVKAHQRQVNMPARSYIRVSLEEMREEIIGGLLDAVRGAI